MDALEKKSTVSDLQSGETVAQSAEILGQILKKGTGPALDPLISDLLKKEADRLLRPTTRVRKRIQKTPRISRESPTK